MIDLGTLNAFWSLLVIIASVGAAAVWLRSTLTKQRHAELENLVDTRGATISDLERTVRKQGEQIAELQGQMKALLQIKTDEIVEGVVDKLIPFLRET